ncbi:MAG: hypothetical protein MPF33_01400 [Candidatus Aramenus sp.]|jgi:2,5-dioxopentanoate dehydrogenase|nr:hypothetical protein [Candidatus Aramenus sp.]
MNKLLILGGLMALLVGVGIAVADSFMGQIASLSYHVTAPSQSSQSSNDTVLLMANINLGNLTAGQSGNYTAEAKVQLSSGYYTFKLNDGALEDEFSQFTVVLKFSNYTITLTKDHHESHKMYLPSGTYDITIVIYYAVSEHAHNATVSNTPLIIIKEENSDNGSDEGNS